MTLLLGEIRFSVANLIALAVATDLGRAEQFADPNLQPALHRFHLGEIVGGGLGLSCSILNTGAERVVNGADAVPGRCGDRPDRQPRLTQRLHNLRPPPQPQSNLGGCSGRAFNSTNSFRSSRDNNTGARLGRNTRRPARHNPT